jgi:hypothetical protein
MDALARKASQSTPGKQSGQTVASPTDPLTDPTSDNLLIDAKKRAAARVTFAPTNLLSEKGLWTLYEAVQKLPLSGASGREASDLSQVKSVTRCI